MKRYLMKKISECTFCCFFLIKRTNNFNRNVCGQWGFISICHPAYLPSNCEGYVMQKFGNIDDDGLVFQEVCCSVGWASYFLYRESYSMGTVPLLPRFLDTSQLTKCTPHNHV